MGKKINPHNDAYARRFILMSLGAVGIFVIFLFIVIPLLFNAGGGATDVKKDIYLKNSDASNDPLLTTVPQLADIIAGPIISAADPLFGPPAAPVTITVYTDFTCWYCGQTVALAQRAQAEFSGLVRLAHKDYPNPNKAYASYQAAIAGRCAQEQDKFWEMSERLYENYDALSPDTFTALAKNLGLDITSFNQCRAGGSANSVVRKIDDNIAEANALGIAGVPLIYVNSRELPAEITYEELKAAVERELY